ncbi:MAG: phenylalanine--tRNA ligase subunit alpha [Bacillota bacterium]|nr:phenylalanine--tRNA ligase subunit alpha [Bacillota bacterium]
MISQKGAGGTGRVAEYIRQACELVHGHADYFHGELAGLVGCIAAAGNRQELDELRQRLLGRRGEVTTLLKAIGKQAPELRRAYGQLVNELRMAVTAALEAQDEELLEGASLFAQPIDRSIPGLRRAVGALHPITQMRYDLDDAFHSLGFEIYREDEISSEAFSFDHLNFPPDHPARESMDTYWISGTEDRTGAERLCLRPHLTGGSVRYLREHGAPARFVYPGPVYRNEATDARHERAFYQYEALVVDRDFSFASGQLLIRTILETVFGREVGVRMRAGFFPFVEPGFEIDMVCQVCGGEGCRTCHGAGWIELMPGGVPHPNVLLAAGLDPDEWTGFYINIGLDRLVMMRYGIEDVRLMHSADLRFLRQYS